MGRDSLASEGSGEGWHLAGPGGRADFHTDVAHLLFHPPLGLSHSVVVKPSPAHPWYSCEHTSLHRHTHTHIHTHTHTHTLGNITADTWCGFLGHNLLWPNHCQPKENAVSVPAQINQTN